MLSTNENDLVCGPKEPQQGQLLDGLRMITNVNVK